MTGPQKTDAEKVAEARAKIDAFLDSAKDAKTPLEFYARLDEWVAANFTATA